MNTAASSDPRSLRDDLKEAAVIMAAFTYNAAMMDQRFPRKAAE
jgi:hypothetical protein